MIPFVCLLPITSQEAPSPFVFPEENDKGGREVDVRSSSLFSSEDGELTLQFEDK